MENFYHFLENNSNYIVLIISFLIWTGIFTFMLKIDKKVSKLEKENSNE